MNEELQEDVRQAFRDISDIIVRSRAWIVFLSRHAFQERELIDSLDDFAHVIIVEAKSQGIIHRRLVHPEGLLIRSEALYLGTIVRWRSSDVRHYGSTMLLFSQVPNSLAPFQYTEYWQSKTGVLGE